MSLILLVEEHFYKNRFNEIQNMNKIIRKVSGMTAKSESSFEELRKEIFDYNFSNSKFQLERLNEIVKPL